MNRYSMHVDGFEPHERTARTASAAKWQDFKAAREAGYFPGPDGFKRYLERVSVRHLGPAKTHTEGGQ